MKNKGLMIIALILGFILTTAGLYFKIMHYPLSLSILISGFVFDILGVVIYFLGVRKKT